MKKENITINDLAGMVQKGFEGVDKQFEKTATVEQVDNLKKWAEGKFDKIDKRFDRIEKVLIEEQNRRIEKLESRMEYLENMLNLPAKN